MRNRRIIDRKIHRDQSGQVMVFSIILLIVLALGALFLFDMHSSIRGKVKAQTASEAAALSMAKWQKESLNIIGELNLMKACDVLTTEVAVSIDKTSEMTDYEWLEAASKLISNAQVRVSFVGPLIGVGAAQVAALNNGINPDTDIQADFDRLISEIDDEVKYPINKYPQNDEYGYEWKEAYKKMLIDIRNTGCAVRPNGITVGLGDIQPTYLAIEEFYDAILLDFWCQPSLKSLLMQNNLPPDWWHPEYNELAFPGESNLATLYTTFRTLDANNFGNNSSTGGSVSVSIGGVSYGDNSVNVHQLLQSMAQEHGWTEQFTDPEGAMLPELQWCLYEEGRWGENAPITDDYNVAGWPGWAEKWNHWMAAPLRAEFLYYGAVSKVQCERNVKLRSKHKAKAESKMLKDTFLEETNQNSATYKTERTVTGRAIAKPIGWIEDEDGEKMTPSASMVILPVFHNVTVVPTTMFQAHMFDYEYSSLEQFLKWLNQQDSLYGPTEGMPGGCSRYLEALRRFDDPQWRKRGYNHDFNESDYSHNDFVSGDYLYDPSTNPKGAGWLQMACPRSSDSVSYYSLNGKVITYVYIYHRRDKNNDGTDEMYREVYKANGNILTLESSTLATGRIPTRHAFSYVVNANNTLTLTGIDYTNDEGLCVQHGTGGHSGGPSRPPGPGIL